MKMIRKIMAVVSAVMMLCTILPLTVSAAADEPTIEIVVDETEFNAGDEFEVTVNLANNPGLIAATVEILYDHDVFEVVVEWDEDEEAWMYPIEVGTTWKASSNKYITFGPIDEDAGVMKKCVVSYIRGTASSNCDKEWFFTATFKVKNDAVTGDYDLAISYKDTDFVNIDKQFVPFAKGDDVTVHVNGTDPVPPTCEHEYDDDCDADCNLCGETREVEHAIVYAEAVAPTCTDEGNIEYWCCDICGAAWLDEALTQSTDLTAVMLPVDEQAHTYLYDCDKYCNNCGEKTRPGAKHNVIHVEAKEAVSCVEFGNVEYWHCDACGAAWLDEDGRYQTNMMSVKTYGPCISDSPACVDGTCINCGLPCLAEAEHAYDDEYDADCNECGDIREVPERPFVYGDLNNDGDITNRDLALIQQYINGWDVEIVNEAADVNGDGEITNRDQALLQQFINGWDVVLGQS